MLALVSSELLHSRRFAKRKYYMYLLTTFALYSVQYFLVCSGAVASLNTRFQRYMAKCVLDYIELLC